MDRYWHGLGTANYALEAFSVVYAREVSKWKEWDMYNKAFEDDVGKRDGEWRNKEIESER